MKQKLTAKEEEIMKIFWERGELCIRELVDGMDEPKPGYTTVSRQVGFLEEKGFLTRRPLANIYLYKAAVSENEYRGETINNYIEKFCGSSYSNVVLQFVKDDKMNIEELKEIINIIEGK